LLLSGRVDLLLSDIDLPDGSGLELCRWTCDQPALRTTKVIICSGRLDPDTERRALEAGVVAFLPKPFELARFAAIIRSHMPPLHLGAANAPSLRQRCRFPCHPVLARLRGKQCSTPASWLHLRERACSIAPRMSAEEAFYGGSEAGLGWHDVR
jgi:DNA-binding response OmpR family regulator